MGANGHGSNGRAWQRPDEADGRFAWAGRFWSAYLDALRSYLDRMDQINTNEDREEEKDD